VAERKTTFSELNGSTIAQIKFALDLFEGAIFIYSVIQKDGLYFVRLYFLNYTWYVNYLHNIKRGRPKFLNTTARALA
jgi:hypothetical protein